MNEIKSCLFCKHFNKNKYGTCKAFPDGIPFPIAAGEIDHIKPYFGDHGIQFEPIEKKGLYNARASGN